MLYIYMNCLTVKQPRSSWNAKKLRNICLDAEAVGLELGSLAFRAALLGIVWAMLCHQSRYYHFRIQIYHAVDVFLPLAHVWRVDASFVPTQEDAAS